MNNFEVDIMSSGYVETNMLSLLTQMHLKVFGYDLNYTILKEKLNSKTIKESLTDDDIADVNQFIILHPTKWNIKWSIRSTLEYICRSKNATFISRNIVNDRFNRHQGCV